MSKKKTIDTLVEDIYAVVREKGGWDSVVNTYFQEQVSATVLGRLGPTDKDAPSGEGKLRMSSIGQPCERKLWYQYNASGSPEELEASQIIRFLYGDILEDFLLALAVAAGHKVEGHQDVMEIKGIKGHRDAVIDGVTIDIKSASTSAFGKFKEHSLETEDPFGYLWQLASYVHAGKDDTKVKDKEGGAFLAIDKQHGTICLDYYNFKELGYLKDIDGFYDRRMKLVEEEEVPPRGFPTEPDGKSGNRKLCFNCSFCEFKKACYPGLRSFRYKGAYGRPRDVHLAVVKREPKVEEIT